MRFSVITPAYNAERYIASAIESVLGQTDVDREHIVIDDCSTDRTAEIVKRYAARYPSLTYVRMPENSAGRPGKVRNAGIALARGVWLSFLDADDSWLPDKLAKVRAAASAVPRASIVHHDIVFVDNSGESLKGRRLSESPEALSGFCFQKLVLYNVFATSAVSVKRDAVIEVGGFDPKASFAEDYDLWLRLTARYQTAFIREALTRYRTHDNNMSRNSLPMRLAVLEALQNARLRFPEEFAQVSKRDLRLRYAELHAGVAYGYLQNGEVAEARKYYLRAAKYSRKANSLLRGLMLLDGGWCYKALKRAGHLSSLPPN